MVNIIIVSGLSGAGKTVALRAFEDIGYYCVDNLPLILLETFLETIKAEENIKGIAIGIDIREKEFLSKAYQIFSEIKNKNRIEILFLEAEKDVMIRRYKETRRPHPMLSFASSGHSSTDIEWAIEMEKAALSVIRESADKIIDTSNYTPHQLRNLIMNTYGDMKSSQAINISLISFGHKYGVPMHLDLLFDVRFLPNPYFVPELKPLKGTDPVISDFVLNKDETKNFLEKVIDMLDFLLPHYIREGRSYIIIGIGCTGGVHRSPAVVERMAKIIEERHGIKPNVIHRDME